MRLTRRTIRFSCALLSSGLLAALLVVAGVQSAPENRLPQLAPASGTEYLCYGYSGCRSEGYSDAGYGAASGRMYWNMYAGHNCTNYAAYRMIKAGMPNERPWSGGGNASEWGKYMSRITDQTPRVGAVAWWGRYDNGSGSAGHVAYVERVESSSTIVVSQDSWGGTFSWKRITKSSGRWPTGFVHFIDEKKIENTSRPQVIGEATVGRTVRATTGSWNPSATRTFQWYADGAKIDRATQPQLTVGVELVGKRLTVKVRARKDGFDSSVAGSVPTAPVARGSFVAVVEPALSGRAQVGSTLTASRGTWSPRPGGTLVRWYADGQLIDSAKGSRFTVTTAYLGRRISAKIAVMGPGYKKQWVETDRTAAVVTGLVKVTRATRITGKRRLGEVLTIRAGSTAPAVGVTARYQWLRDGDAVPGATGTTYRLTKADVGSHLSVRVTHQKPTYAAAVERAHAGANGADVRAATKVRLTKAEANGRQVRIAAHVTSSGAQPVTGVITLSIAGRERTVWLRNGRAEVTIRGVPTGDWWARGWYHPTAALFADRASWRVHVSG